jgi:hypothetical protein
MPRPLALLVLAATLAAATVPARAAVWQGRNVDGRTWHCDAMTNDFGRFNGCEVRFNGERAYLTLASGTRIILILEDEIIADPHQVVAFDHRRGIRWELDVHDLSGR